MTFILLAFIGRWGSLYVSILLIMAGIANCGPDALLAGSVTAVIGERYGHGLGAGVTSLVNGFGSIGAIVEGPIIGIMSQFVGWNGVIACMVALCAITSVALLKAHDSITSEERHLPSRLDVEECKE